MDRKGVEMNTDEAYDIGRSDGLAWYQQRDIGALAGDHEDLIPDDFYPAYVRGVSDGIREGAGEDS